MAMLVPVLVTMRQVTLSIMLDNGEKCFTAWPSTSRIVSPGRRPAFPAGPVGSTQPTTVELSASLLGLPTPQTTTANSIASKKLNSGPANATMILSSGETGGNWSAGVSVLPSTASIVAICGNKT